LQYAETQSTCLSIHSTGYPSSIGEQTLSEALLAPIIFWRHIAFDNITLTSVSVTMDFRHCGPIVLLRIRRQRSWTLAFKSLVGRTCFGKVLCCDNKGQN